MKKLFKIVMMFVSIMIGIYMLVEPEKITMIIIQVIGVGWILLGIVDLIELILDYLEWKES